MALDSTALDVMMLHPVFAPMSWASVPNPGTAKLESLKPALQEAYGRAVQLHARATPPVPQPHYKVGKLPGRRPSVAALPTASARVRLSRLARMRPTCISTVRGLRCSSCAMTRSVRPSAT